MTSTGRGGGCVGVDRVRWEGVGWGQHDAAASEHAAPRAYCVPVDGVHAVLHGQVPQLHAAVRAAAHGRKTKEWMNDESIGRSVGGLAAGRAMGGWVDRAKGPRTTRQSAGRRGRPPRRAPRRSGRRRSRRGRCGPWTDGRMKEVGKKEGGSMSRRPSNGGRGVRVGRVWVRTNERSIHRAGNAGQRGQVQAGRQVRTSRGR